MGGQILWENPNPTSSIGNSDITVFSMENFQYLIIGCRINSDGTQAIQYTKVKKSFSAKNIYLSITNNDNNNNYHRRIQLVDNTTINIQQGYIGDSANNTACIPVVIYGTNDLGYMGSSPSVLDSMPIGYVYISTSNISPETLFGGSWRRIEGVFLLAATQGLDNPTLTNLGWSRSSNGYHYWTDSAGNRHNITNVGNYDGEVKHTLTVAEMPSHNHNNSGSASHRWGAATGWGSETITANFGVHLDRVNDVVYDGGVIDSNVYTGGGDAHNNISPYVTVYMWERIA